MNKENKINDLKIGIGFEQYLLDTGWERFGFYEVDYFNTYNQCVRGFKKDNKEIRIGLVGSPCRIGIWSPGIYEFDNEGNIVKDYTYAPNESQYENYVKKLTEIQNGVY